MMNVYNSSEIRAIMGQYSKLPYFASGCCEARDAL